VLRQHFTDLKQDHCHLTRRNVGAMVHQKLAPQITDLSAAPSVAATEQYATTLQDSDRELLGQVALQDPHAFAMLYARYAPRIRRYLLRYSGQADFADDVLQEVMLVLWQRPSSCPPTVPLIAWLCGIARHKAHKVRMRMASRPLAPAVPANDQADTPEDLLLQQEAGHVLDQALDALPFYEQTALRLLVQQGYAYQEIAAVMGTPISTVRTRLWRAQHRLRDHVMTMATSPLRSRPSRESTGRSGATSSSTRYRGAEASRTPVVPGDV
jgi:RNA polymerase sigma-70 factor (ECF subfamily)